MTPKEKAKELICKFEILEGPCFNGNTVELEQIGHNTGKKCALVAVDEIIITRTSGVEFFYYWNEVKKEIEKL
jgi:hypothetical protein